MRRKFCKMMDIPNTNENVNVGMNFSRMHFYHDSGDISPEVVDVILYAKVREAHADGGVASC